MESPIMLSASDEAIWCASGPRRFSCVHSEVLGGPDERADGRGGDPWLASGFDLQSSGGPAGRLNHPL